MTTVLIYTYIVVHKVNTDSSVDFVKMKGNESYFWDLPLPSSVSGQVNIHYCAVGAPLQTYRLGEQFKIWLGPGIYQPNGQFVYSKEMEVAFKICLPSMVSWQVNIHYCAVGQVEQFKIWLGPGIYKIYIFHILPQPNRQFVNSKEMEVAFEISSFNNQSRTCQHTLHSWPRGVSHYGKNIWSFWYKNGQDMSCEGACAHARVRRAVARVRVRAKRLLKYVCDVRACGHF